MYQVIESKPFKRNYLIIIKLDKKEEEYIISEELLLEFRLVKGKILEDIDYKKFIEAAKRDEIYQKVLHYALFKQRCSKDIIDYLNKKNIPLENHNYYLNKLKKSRILDDVSYTQNYIHESFYYKRYGTKKIIEELKKKEIPLGISIPLINNIPESDIYDNVEYLFNKKLKSIKNKSINNAISSIKQYIISKGYKIEIVNHLVEESKEMIYKLIPEDEALEKDYLTAKRKYSKDKTKEKQNILAYLLRKGYTYNKIKTRMEADHE